MSRYQPKPACPVKSKSNPLIPRAGLIFLIFPRGRGLGGDEVKGAALPMGVGGPTSWSAVVARAARGSVDMQAPGQMPETTGWKCVLPACCAKTTDKKQGGV